MDLSDSDELLLAVAAARLSVEFQASHPAVAEQAEELMHEVLDRHGVTPAEATEAVLGS